jgi:hypothetical protein
MSIRRSGAAKQRWYRFRVPRSPSPAGATRPSARRSPRPLLIIVAVAGLIAIGAFVASGTGKGPGATKDGPGHRRFDVGEVTCTFVDHSRSSTNWATGVQSPYRVLATEIRYPTYSAGGAGVPASTKPFPLIVFAQGFATMPDWYAPLLDEWVRAGFVVAAPVFPETNALAVRASKNPEESEADDIHQPGDVVFVIHSLLDASRSRSAACPRAFGLLDASRIGLAGQSDGGDTVGMAAYDSEYDSHPGLHFRAVAVLSGAEWPWPATVPDPYANHLDAPPLLAVQSATDACNPPQDSVKLYDDDANPSKWYLEIFNAEHLAPYDRRNLPAFAIVARTTTRFFQIELAGDASGARLMKIGNSESQVAQITTGASAPSIAPVAQSTSACYIGLEGLTP